MEDAETSTELRCAALEGDSERVRTLLTQQQADVNTANFQKNTSLHLATLHGHETVVALLLKHGANLDAANMNGQTCLHLACTKGFLPIVKLLTKHGSQLHLQNDLSGMTALHYASRAGQAQVCQHLLDVGADEDVPDTIGKIAEFYAANYPTELVFRKRKEQKPNKQGKQKPVTKNEQPPKPQQPKSKETPPVVNPVRAQDQDSHAVPPTTSKTGQRSTTSEPIAEQKPSPKPTTAPKQTQQKEEPTTAPKQTQQKEEPTTAPKQTQQKEEPKLPMKEETKQPEEVPTPHQASIPVPAQSMPSPNEKAQEVSSDADRNTERNTTKPTRTQANTEQTRTGGGGKNTNRGGLASNSRDATNWNRDPNKYGHTPGGGNVSIENNKFNWKAEGSGYGQGSLKRNELDKRKDQGFEWSEEFKQRQQQSVFDRLMGGGAKTRARDRGGQQGQGRGASPEKAAARKWADKTKQK